MFVGLVVGVAAAMALREMAWTFVFGVTTADALNLFGRRPYVLKRGTCGGHHSRRSRVSGSTDRRFALRVKPTLSARGHSLRGLPAEARDEREVGLALRATADSLREK